MGTEQQPRPDILVARVSDPGRTDPGGHSNPCWKRQRRSSRVVRFPGRDRGVSSGDGFGEHMWWDLHRGPKSVASNDGSKYLWCCLLDFVPHVTPSAATSAVGWLSAHSTAPFLNAARKSRAAFQQISGRSHCPLHPVTTSMLIPRLHLDSDCQPCCQPSPICSWHTWAQNISRMGNWRQWGGCSHNLSTDHPGNYTGILFLSFCATFSFPSPLS